MSEGYTQEQQKLLIEAILSDRDLFSRCQHILQPDFFNRQFQKAVKFILHFAEEYKSVPTVQQIEAESGIKFELLDKISEEHQQYFLDTLEQFCRHQALTQAILKGSELLEKEEYGGIEKLVRDALLIGLEKDIGIDYFADPKARLQRLKDSNGLLSTGWKTLDQIIYNVNRGELAIFAAPSGGGKSVVLQNLAVNMSYQGLNVVYITLELSKELCSKRIDSMLTGIKQSDIFKKLDDVEFEVKMAAKRSGNLYVKELPNGCNARDIKAYLKEYQIQRGHRPDVVLIDYLDLMSPNDKRVSPSDLFVKDKYVSEELRALAKEQQFWCATASQFNRSAIDSIEFNHSHIAGGLSKIQTCDLAVGIFNNARSRERGEIEFQLLKTRNSGGVDQKIVLGYDIDTLRITDLQNSPSSKPKSNSANDVMSRIQRKPQTSEQDTETASTPQASESVRNNNLSDLLNKIKK